MWERLDVVSMRIKIIIITEVAFNTYWIGVAALSRPPTSPSVPHLAVYSLKMHVNSLAVAVSFIAVYRLIV